MKPISSLPEIFDSWLFDVIFQPASNWFQRLVGKDNFFLAALFLTLHIGIALYTDLTNQDFALHVIPLSATLGKILFLYPAIYRKSEEMSRHTGDLAFGNNYRINQYMRVLRVCFYTFAFCAIVVALGRLSRSEPVGDTFILIGVNRFLFVVALYFMACTPLPPKKSKLGKLLSATGKWVANIWNPGDVAPAPT